MGDTNVTPEPSEVRSSHPSCPPHSAIAKSLLGAVRVAAMVGGGALASYVLVTQFLVEPPGKTAPVAASARPAKPAVAATAPVAPSPNAAPAPKEKASKEASSNLPDAKIEDLPTPTGFALDSSRGLLEVVTPNREAIHINGTWMGRGPLRRIPIGAGEHEVEIRTEVDSRKFDVNVRAGRRVRVTLGAN